jgi:DNA invertase Pin-like site-specific DNA recombinase
MAFSLGRFGGTGNGMSREVKDEMTRRLARGELQCEIAAAVGVNRMTIYRFVTSGNHRR